jgi:GTPase Era involved in 16S rRNA processing
MRFKKNFRFFVTILLMISVAISAHWWLPELLVFIVTNTALVQGLSSFIQILLWIPPLLILPFKLWKHDRIVQKNSSISTDSEHEHKTIGVSIPLHKLCESLLDIVTENVAIIKLPNILEDVQNLLQDVRDGVLRIYFFGHQSAGKSTLINALLDSQISPISSGKMTACLIRIRQGEKFAGKIKWTNQSKIFKPDINFLKRKMQDEWSLLPFEDQPHEIIIEITESILSIPKLELVDTPGTGSIWNDKYGRNLLDETVNKKIKTAAIAILVYKHDQADMQPHGSILQNLRTHGIKVLGLCNITPDLDSNFQDDKKDTLLTINKAEKQLQDAANAECHRVVLKEKESLLKLASKIDGKTVSEFRYYLTKLLGDRESFLNMQAIRESLILVNELIEEANKTIREHQPVFNNIKTQKAEIKSAISSVRNTIKEGYDNTKVSTQATIAGGAAMGIAGVSAVYLLGSVATGGLLLPAVGLLVGGFAGNFLGNRIEKSRLEVFEKMLSDVWKELQRTIQNAKIKGTPMLTQNIIKEVLDYSSSLSKNQNTLESVMRKVEEDLESNLQKIPGYDLYIKSEILVEKLCNLRDQFQARSKNPSGVN